ncbi:hypothetical protein [Xanthomonas graminis]|uniref:hypothetical protein n=1 Tax=Xanthomonas graminis TaxID=3390026 RepID=UPI001641AF1F|nr:hypothetical protein [Xanthomonas translucens]UKE65555.1 hypothetical protein KM547_18195 [Xanthomonas translucens pv. phlei]UKE73065.1 hypothetical protein KFS85_18940 [Xanthomonas translucens pv. phleipratensis]
MSFWILGSVGRARDHAMTPVARKRGGARFPVIGGDRRIRATRTSIAKPQQTSC